MNIAVSAGCSAELVADFPKKQVIEYICAICGAGKTTSYTAYIKNATSCFIVACRSNRLCSQVYEEMTRQGVTDLAMIYGDEQQSRKKREKEAVTKRLLEAITGYTHRVIIATHQGLELLAGYVHDNMSLRAAIADYVIIIDEHPNYSKPFKEVVNLQLKDEYRWLAHTVSNNGQRFCVNPDGLRRSLADTRSRRVVIALLNGDKVSERVSEDGLTLTLKGSARSDLYALASYSKSFIFVAARANKLPFAIQGKEYGLALIENAQIVIDEARKEYRNQSRISLGCFVSGTATKKRTIRHLEKLAEHIAAYMKKIGKPFLFACNLDDSDNPFFMGAEWESVYRKHLEPIGGVWVPYSSHGLNDYRDYTVTLWLGIGKLPPFIRAMLSEDVARATDECNTADAGYQFAARSALRNIDDDQTRLVLLSLDEEVMNFMKSEIVPGAAVLDVPRFQIDESKADHSKRTFTKGQQTKQRVIAECERLTVAGLKVTAAAVCESVAGVGLTRVKAILKEWREGEKVTSTI